MKKKTPAKKRVMRPGPMGARLWAGGSKKVVMAKPTNCGPSFVEAGNVTHGSDLARAAAKMGRPKSPSVVAETLGQAAAITNLTREQLQWARNEGAPGFRGSRVVIAELMPWWEENKDLLEDEDGLPSEDLLDRKLKLQKLQSLERDEEIRVGKYTLTETVRVALANIAAEQNAALLGLPRELPPKLLGADAIAMAGTLQASVTRVLEIFQTGVRPWLPAPGPEPEYQI